MRTHIDSSVLSVNGQYCHHIKSLIFDIDFAEDLSFFRDNGHELGELDIDQKNEEKILEFCPKGPA